MNGLICRLLILMFLYFSRLMTRMLWKIYTHFWLILPPQKVHTFSHQLGIKLYSLYSLDCVLTCVLLASSQDFIAVTLKSCLEFKTGLQLYRYLIQNNDRSTDCSPAWNHDWLKIIAKKVIKKEKNAGSQSLMLIDITNAVCSQQNNTKNVLV